MRLSEGTSAQRRAYTARRNCQPRAAEISSRGPLLREAVRDARCARACPCAPPRSFARDLLLAIRRRCGAEPGGALLAWVLPELPAAEPLSAGNSGAQPNGPQRSSSVSASVSVSASAGAAVAAALASSGLGAAGGAAALAGGSSGSAGGACEERLVAFLVRIAAEQAGGQYFNLAHSVVVLQVRNLEILSCLSDLRGVHRPMSVSSAA